MNRKDIYETVTANIIANLEEAGSWSRMWTTSNPISLEGREYTGINRLLLRCSNYSSNVFGTYNQIQKHGGCVKRGEKGHFVLFWKINKSMDGETEKEKTWLMERYYYVFNSDQCEFNESGTRHLTSLIGTKNENMLIKAAEEIVACIPYYIPIEHNSTILCPAYYPIQDKIKIYPREQFHSSEEYFSVLFHELVHSSGHPSRLARIEPATRFGDHAYSKEELVAEFGSAFMCEIAGIEGTIESSAAYIRSWSHALRSNPDWVVSAVSKARKAVEFLVPEMKEVEVLTELVEV